ncbi:MAG: cytochrome c oxidase subunit II [Actinobacteria bacterium]|nr:cytochrome c oxidase subunit II [Actinomycetota bacterium]
MVHRSEVIKMAVIVIVAAAATAIVAYFIPWLPKSASEQMDRIAFVYWFATIMCIAIFALVVAVLVYSVWAFRASPYDEADGAHIHGHSGLEIVWTVVPFILVVALGVVSAVVMAKNNNATNPLRVKVYAQQFAFRFEYPDQGGIKTNELTLPVRRDVKLELESADVIHSFWIPVMGQKQDIVPGDPMELIVTPTRTGEFPLVCAELCGLGHATMRAKVHVLSQADFAAWVREKRGDAGGGSGSGGGSGGGGSDLGASTFASAGCGGCHAFAPAGSSGAVGPKLDDLDAAAKAAGEPLEQFVRQSIVEPDAIVAEGFQAGVMPKTYGDSLEAEEIDALVAYLTESTGTEGKG